MALALAALAVMPQARADSLSGTRTDGLREGVLRIALRFERDHAQLTVQRSVFNSAAISDQATWLIDLPQGAVATGLRTRSVGPGPQRWFAGELLEADEAGQRYEMLTGFGRYPPKDPVLLSWVTQSQLALQAFRCPPRAEKLLEYTLVMPTEYRAGAYHVIVPALGSKDQPVELDVRAARASDNVPLGKESRIHVTHQRAIDLSLVPESASPLEAAIVSLRYATGSVLTRYTIRAAPKLSRLPEQASIVLVVDASRSTSTGFEAAAKTALDAYLSRFVAARVEVLTFDRHVRRLLGRFAPVRAARAALAALTLERKNGSDVDLALFEADRLLADAPPGSARRIVLVTDGLTRSGLGGERLRGALTQSNAVVHVGLLDASDTPELSRNDEQPWASALRARHGMVWNARAPLHPDADLRAAVAHVYEEWARPLRIDNLSLFSDNQGLVERVTLGALAEGAGQEELYVDSRATRELNVTGELWVEPVRVSAVPNAADNPLWAALAFGSPLTDGMADADMTTLAQLGRAVSPVTSYLAIEPGVRPSTEGLPVSERSSGIGLVSPVFASACGYEVSGRGPVLNRQAYLEQVLKAEYQRCGGKLGAYELQLELTRDEVVRVHPSLRGDAADELVESCLAEAAWALALPAGFDEDWQTYNVEL